MMYFNTYASLEQVNSVFLEDETITVEWSATPIPNMFNHPGPMIYNPTSNVPKEVNRDWLCQELPWGTFMPAEGNFRCRVHGDKEIRQGCTKCDLRFTNSAGLFIDVFHVRHWLIFIPVLNVYMLLFNTHATLAEVEAVFTEGTTLKVDWLDTGKPKDDNLCLSFVHGASSMSLEHGRLPAKIRHGFSNNILRDFSPFSFITYPKLGFGDTWRVRQYYITDKYTGLPERYAALVGETVEEQIWSGQFDAEPSLYGIGLYHDAEGSTFGTALGTETCTNNPTATLVCSGYSTPQPFYVPFMQITCGVNTYVGTDFYHFSRYPMVPYRVYMCKIGDALATHTRPTVKLIGYFNTNFCGTTLQDKTYDASYC